LDGCLLGGDYSRGSGHNHRQDAGQVKWLPVTPVATH
jgi:hypothetical protein